MCMQYTVALVSIISIGSKPIGPFWQLPLLFIRTPLIHAHDIYPFAYTHTHTHTHTRLQKTLVRLRVRKTVWLYAACTSPNVAPKGARPAAPLQNTWASTSSEISHINRSSVSRIMLNVLLCFFLVRGTVCNDIAFALN